MWPPYAFCCLFVCGVGLTAAKPSGNDSINLSPSDIGKCGWSKPDISMFEERKDEHVEFPWMVAIIKKGDSDVWSRNDYLGGGSIIHSSVVITVAHNFDKLDAKQIKCRGGEWDTQSTKEQYPFQERDVNKKHLHPQFFETSLYYDVALLILEKPFDLDSAPHMGIACLNTVLPKPGTQCYTMGWGMDLFRSQSYVLKQTELSLVSSADCQNELQSTRLGPYFRLHSSLTCAGGKDGIGACQGDWGSSLVCPIQKNGDRVRYAVAGIASYGIACGRDRIPGVYVNVPEIYPWVTEVMMDESFGKDSYAI